MTPRWRASHRGRRLRAGPVWKPGQKGKDNGVLLVIATGDRRIRIETGKGVGGELTDLQSNDIIRRRIAPLMRENRVHDAILAGIDGIAEALSGDATAASPSRVSTPPVDWQQPPVVLPRWFDVCFWGFILLVVLMLLLPRQPAPAAPHLLGRPPSSAVAGGAVEAAAGAAGGGVEVATAGAASPAAAAARAAAAAPATATDRRAPEKKRGAVGRGE